MPRYINADTVVTIQVYNDMTEEYGTKRVTIADAIDEWSDEGCPPFADVVERKTGRWLVIEDEWWDGGGRYECSVCGCGFAFGAFHEMNEQHYCPNCGARMDL